MTAKTSEEQMPDESISRRHFAHRVMAGTASGSLIAVASAGSMSALADEPAKSPAAVKETTSAPDPDEPPRREPPEEAYLLGLVLKRYPDERLSERAIGDILQDIRSDTGRSRVLSAFPLRNSDEPGFVFRAWRADD